MIVFVCFILVVWMFVLFVVGVLLMSVVCF